MVKILLLCSVLTSVVFAQAEQSSTVSVPSSRNKPRIFVTDSDSWEIRGSAGGHNGTFAANTSGGARPQTAEIVKTFGERCSEVTVNNNSDLADYAVVLQHEGGKGFARKRNKVAVFNSIGDSIFSDSTRSIGSSVSDACNAIIRDWAAHGTRSTAENPKAIQEVKATPELRMRSRAKLNVASNPTGAEIEIDGSFVGNTPSSLELAEGEHVVAVKKLGFRAWEKKIRITGGDINISTDLEKDE